MFWSVRCVKELLFSFTLLVPLLISFWIIIIIIIIINIHVLRPWHLTWQHLYLYFWYGGFDCRPECWLLCWDFPTDFSMKMRGWSIMMGRDNCQATYFKFVFRRVRKVTKSVCQLYNKTNRLTNFPNLFLSRNSTCFEQFLSPSSGVFHSTFYTGICHQTCITYTSAECTMENSWWWAEELPETFRVSCQK